MKKIISLFVCTTVFLSTIPVFAQNDTQNADDTVTDSTKNKVCVNAIISHTPYMKESDVTFELSSQDGKLLGTSSMHITPDTKNVTFEFDVPEYEIGTSFSVKATSGIDSFIYYDDTYHIDSNVVLPTYTYVDDNGNRIDSTDISVTINPLYDKSINLYYNGNDTAANGARVIDGTAMVPARALAEFIGFNVYYDQQYKSEVISLDNKYMFFNVDTAYTTIFGTDLFAPHPTVMINGTVYIPLRTFADALGSTLDVRDYGAYMDINISESQFVKDYFAKLPVNQWGISSRTNYMVWVSLSEYKVRLYEGRQYHWKPMLEATCAIGAPGTPTVTGSFEYNYKTRWDYGTYYVGPCLVFYRGYALHSVLLYQNGTEYDGRVGMKLSHGCIRLKKKDIDFIANTIPVGTRIYITP